MYHVHTTAGIVLRKVGIGEANLLLHVLTSDLGLIVLTAQGARAVTSKLSPSLLEFSSISISCVRGKNGWKATSAILKENFFLDYPAYAGLSVARISSLLIKLIPGEEPHPSLFDMVLSGFEQLKNFSIEETADFECLTVLRILRELGYVGDMTEDGSILFSSSFGREALALARDKRKKLISIINTGISASNLS